LTRAAVFLVATVSSDPDSRAAVRAFCGDLATLVRAVGFRALEDNLSCVMGIGSDAWDRIFGAPRPVELHPFREIKSGPRHAVATPGDLMFHIRAKRMDLCFEMATQIVQRLGGAITVADEVHGFRYFDDRDLIGFVDGTENPTGSALPLSSLIQYADDPDFEGGSYVVVQKYLHKLSEWNALKTADQEAIIGRTKPDNVELEDAGGRKSHKSLATIVDSDGNEHDILRDNMPFGRPGQAEFGTYFIGYARDLWVVEQMLRNMFIGVPEGEYDRILDFSTARTGTTFFVPSNAMLESLGEAGGA
jgi:putative iron-dependent peroxidase